MTILRKKIDIWVRRKVYQEQKMVVRGQNSAQDKEGLSNSQPRQGLAVGMMDVLLLRVRKQR